MPTDLFKTRFVDCYIVMCSTGEYSDRSENAIAVFLQQESAVALVAELDEKARELGMSLFNFDYDNSEEATKIEKFNAHFGFEVVWTLSYTGVRFSYHKTIFGG